MSVRGSPAGKRGELGATHRRALHLVFAIMKASNCVVMPAEHGAGDPSRRAAADAPPGDVRGRKHGFDSAAAGTAF